MTTFVEKIERSNDNPRDPRNREVILPAPDPYNSNLATPINSSPLVKAFINNLPAYRQGLSPFRRGLEVGLAHGYWLIGPFFEFNPLRLSHQGALVALLSTFGLIVISTGAIALYAASNPPNPTATITAPNPPEAFNRPDGWFSYAKGFLVGGLGGSLFAYLILTNVDVFKNALSFAGF
ncbi:MAG: photosystem I reaction center subunit XI [Snowella sp.]|nr:photosystem I reaction center subunit XI [Snowella sp.]